MVAKWFVKDMTQLYMKSQGHALCKFCRSRTVFLSYKRQIVRESIEPRHAMMSSCPTSCSATFTNYDVLKSAALKYNDTTDPYGDINGWCFPTVTDMSYLLSESFFNSDSIC